MSTSTHRAFNSLFLVSIIHVMKIELIFRWLFFKFIIRLNITKQIIVYNYKLYKLYYSNILNTCKYLFRMLYWRFVKFLEELRKIFYSIYVVLWFRIVIHRYIVLWSTGFPRCIILLVSLVAFFEWTSGRFPRTEPFKWH